MSAIMGERTRVSGTERTEEVASVWDITASPATGHSSHTGHLSWTNHEEIYYNDTQHMGCSYSKHRSQGRDGREGAGRQGKGCGGWRLTAKSVSQKCDLLSDLKRLCPISVTY